MISIKGLIDEGYIIKLLQWKKVRWNERRKVTITKSEISRKNTRSDKKQGWKEYSLSERNEGFKFPEDYLMSETFEEGLCV